MNLSIHTQEEIVEQLQQQYQLLTTWLEEYPEEHFDLVPASSNWSAGQHADHLIRSTKPLNKIMRFPRLMLKTTFGTCNRAERTFEEVIAKYKKGLAAGGQATGDFIPPKIENNQKTALIDTLNDEVKKLNQVTLKWSASDFSKYVIPHPLIGKLTLREMMFFTIYHTHHHLSILKDRY